MMSVIMRRYTFNPVLALTAGISAAAVLVALAGAPATLLLRYERHAVLAGEVWRLLSAHLVHLGNGHLVMNLAALWLIWAVFMRHSGGLRWWLYTLVSALGVGLGLLTFSPGIQWYVGLSGVLHGLIAAALIEEYRTAPLMATGLGIGLAFKLGWEQFHGALPSSEHLSGGPVIVDAHLYGAIAGMVIAAARLRSE